MQNWEYKIIRANMTALLLYAEDGKNLLSPLDLIPFLNLLGKNGWEIINFMIEYNFTNFVLKRPIE